MRPFLAILILLGAFFFVKYFYTEMVRFRDQEERPRKAEPQGPGDASLPGLPPTLEGSLENARRGGAAGLRNWLRVNRPYVKDPRLASIELDYVLLLSNEDPQQAKRLFQAVKARTPPSSPVYPRIKSLEKTYQ